MANNLPQSGREPIREVVSYFADAGFRNVCVSEFAPDSLLRVGW